ncbi:MAG: amino acid ABC transporter permease [Eubacteriaceae bacterium]|jgi:His/Glu/Gln/Arg/opine family amino acid ABC transporter permease subunit|nr:amino acid ABC transporter permease [Eubacteriaceae bacterium]
MEKIIKIWVKYYYVFLNGLWGTLWMAGVTVMCGTVLGMVIAFLRMSRFAPAKMLSSCYIELLRGTPVLLQLYFFWLVLPKIINMDFSDTACVVIALIINSSAYISEIIRAGISAVDTGQWEAAKSLGLSSFNMLRKIIVPQAVKNILPALCNQFIAMVKETSLASIFFVGELTTSYKSVQSMTYLALQPLIISGVIYFVVTFILSRVVSLVERRLTVSD